MKITFFRRLFILVYATSSLLQAATHYFVNATNVPITFNRISYGSAFCHDNFGTLRPGEVGFVDAGSCRLTGIDVTTSDAVEYLDKDGLKKSKYFSGTRTSGWPGSQQGVFRIYLDTNWQQLVIVRQNENTALDNYSEKWDTGLQSATKLPQ